MVVQDVVACSRSDVMNRMMNGEIPSVPIITLAGVTSLTDLLPELPLPTPLSPGMHNKSLLFNPKIADDARKILETHDETLAQQLAHSLKQTSTDHIELKDTLASDAIEGDIPDLLKMVLRQNPSVFHTKTNNTTSTTTAGVGGNITTTTSTASSSSSSSSSSSGSGFEVRSFDSRTPHQNLTQQQSENFIQTRQQQQQQQTQLLHPQPPHELIQSQQTPLPQYHSGHFAMPYHLNQNNASPGMPQMQVDSSPRYPTNSQYPPHANFLSPTMYQQQQQQQQHQQQHHQQQQQQQQFQHFAQNQRFDQNTVSPRLAAVAEHINLDILSPPESAGSAYSCKRRSSSAKSTLGAKHGDSFETKSPAECMDICQDMSGRRKSVSDNMSLHQMPFGLQRDSASCSGDFHQSSRLPAPFTATASSSCVEADMELCKRRTRNMSSDKIDQVKACVPFPMVLPDDCLPHQQEQSRQIKPEDDEELSFSKQVDLLVSKNSKPIVVLELLDPKTLQSVVSGGRIRTDCDTMKKIKSTKRLYSSDEEEEMDETARKKRRKRHKRMNQRALNSEELFESPTFKKFAQAVEYVFDSAEEIDFGSLDPNDEDTECPPESLIPRQILAEICGEAAKLKAQKVTNQIPSDRLVKLLTILQWNVRDGVKLVPYIKTDEDDEDDDESVMWREMMIERVMRSMDASLAALYIITAPDMPKQVYLDDVIERIILFGKWQLQNTIYPEFDPVYKIDPHSKGGYQGNLKSKRARTQSVKHKSTINLYNKLCELVKALSELLQIQELTDTVILQLSTLSVSPFFVENISEMQLNSMKLVTNIFSKYDKHRQLILEDIFASLARLPSTKRNLRNYRLNSEESIQMVTALALQLIQCVVKLPPPKSIETDICIDEKPIIDKKILEKKKKDIDEDVIIVTSYETAMRTGYNFLSVFLKKCTAKSEDDYRPLFENFVQDLLSTVNKPEWPASELLLSLLGRILVQQFSNKSTDMSLRVASLEYLGIVAARLRSDAVSSQMNPDMIEEIISKIDCETIEENDIKKECKKESVDDVKQTQNLQKAMLYYLAENRHSDPALLFARQFYIAQWYRDFTVEAEKLQKKISKLKAEEEDERAEEVNITLEIAEDGKAFLMSIIEIPDKPANNMRQSQCRLDAEDSCLVARYLSSKRPFAQSFDIYLTQILRVLGETAVAVRTKAMKCLSAVVEADPGILARDDMQRGVHGRFLDQSTSVREAAVELVGKFILIRPELIPKYYEMLCDRILDTGISVRKRVIKIFKDICLGQPDFTKIPEMCVKMIRRVNDEEGIKKLVNEVFQMMWFCPLREKESSRLFRRVVNITEVVAACKDSGLEFFEHLLENLLKKDDDGHYNKNALLASRQIVNCLVENVMSLEEKCVDGDSTSHPQRLIACLTTLHLFSKIKPDLMVQHAITLQPYLNIKCNTQGDVMVLHFVARILEVVVPLMDHPSETFLAQLEEDMMKLILKHGMMVLQSCVSCLGAVVNNVSHNYRLVKDCFQKFFGVLSKLMADHKENANNPTLQKRRPTLLRSLFTVGLLCRHFDFDSKEMGETKAKVAIKDRVFDVLYYFIEHEDEEVRVKALTGLGFMCVRHYEYMLGKTLRGLYYHLFTSEVAAVKLKIQALRNLHSYLVEEEAKMIVADAEWRKQCKAEDLRDMGDLQSGMASTIIQVYLKQVLESFICANFQVRQSALDIIQLVLRQGLVHPVQCVPYLITLGTESDPSVRVRSDQQLQDIDKKYPGFIHMKALQGVKMSYKFQSIIQNPSEPVRGLRTQDAVHLSLNAFLYTVLRANRTYRRALLTSLLNLFDDSARASLEELLYIADNLAFFAYQSQDEPLFIIHQIDIIVSVSGSNLLQSFKECLLPRKESDRRRGETFDDDDDEEIESIMERLPENVVPLQEICRISQGCVLLLVLKQHLKDLYGFTDTKVHRYSPAEAAKVYDKPLARKYAIDFQPNSTIELLKKKPSADLDEDGKRKLIEEFLDFKQLMLSIDPPDDEDSDDNTKHTTPIKNPAPDRAENHLHPKQTSEIHISDKVSDGSDGIKPRSQHQTPFQQMPRNQHYAALLDRKKKIKSSPKIIPKPPLKKKVRKKRRRLSDSEDDGDSDEDPDFIV
ncbi:nipped-B-like protein A [Argonauta hians]